MRGNGSWTFTPKLTADDWARAAYRSINIVADAAGGLQPGRRRHRPSEVIYKVQAANVITSQKIAGAVRAHRSAATRNALGQRESRDDVDRCRRDRHDAGSAVPLTVDLRTEVTGAYETLVRIQM